MLPPEQGNRVKRGWLAVGKREDTAYTEQSQNDAQKLGLDYLCFGTVG